MLAGVSHDLRTPLTRIKLQLEMYSNQKGNEDLLKDVNEMQYMLETYLDFSQTASSEEDTEVDLKEANRKYYRYPFGYYSIKMSRPVQIT